MIVFFSLPNVLIFLNIAKKIWHLIYYIIYLTYQFSFVRLKLTRVKRKSQPARSSNISPLLWELSILIAINVEYFALHLINSSGDILVLSRHSSIRKIQFYLMYEYQDFEQ